MKKLLLPLLAFSLVLASCDVTSLNQNEKEAEEVPAEPIFTNAQIALGKHIHDNNINMGIYNLMAQYMTTTDYPQEPRYELSNRTIPSNVWEDLYRDVLIDLQEARNMVNDNELLDDNVRQNQLASIEVLEIQAFYILVTTFGDIPYTEAVDPDNTQPVYDDQQVVYEDLLNRIDAAISQFNPDAEGFSSSADVFLDGNIGDWITYANSLKMRLGITVADSDLAQQGQTAVEEAAPNAISSNEENVMMPYQTASPHSNPLWEELVESGRDDYIPSAPMVERMNTLEDPRRSVFFTTVGDGEYEGGVFGAQNTYAEFSHFSETIEQRDRPGTVISYSEVEFILAEAAARGWTVEGTAAEHYENAIRADMEFWGVAEDEITAYLAQPEVSYGSASGDFREVIGTQKWFALFLQGHQGWTEYRRLGYPELETHPEAIVDEVPSRYTYPITEQNFNNANYSEAASNIGGDELTTPLFWDPESN